MSAISVGHAQGETQEDFVCNSGAVRRVVSVINQDAADGGNGHGCRVDYTKDGSTHTLWSSKSGHAYCAAKAAALVTQLIEGRFSCKPETVDKDEGAAQEPPAAPARD